MPLHSAVNGGNIKAVEVCLEAGAPVNALQVNIFKLINTSQPSSTVIDALKQIAEIVINI